MTLARCGVWIIGVGLAVVMSAPCGWSETPPPEPAGRDQVDELLGRYNLHPSLEKLGRGLANFFGGWLEVPLNVGKRYSASDTGGSLVTGFAYGMVKGAVRTAVGAYETVTFFLPYPEDFVPILPTLEYYQHSTKRKPLPLE